MKMTTIANIEIESIEQGQAMLDAVNKQINSLNDQMKEATSNDEWELIFNEKYELIKTRRAIQAAMGVIAANNYKEKLANGS